MDKIFFTRRTQGLGKTGFAWMETPQSAAADDIQLELIYPHTEKRDHRGLLIEGFHRNYLLRSSNNAGVAGIAPGSLAGTGVNGSSITDDTVDTISGPITNPFPKAWKFLAGTAHAADLCVSLPNSISTAGDADITAAWPYWLTGWIKNDTSATTADEVVVEIRRPAAVGGDDKYWNAATPAWQVGAVWNSTGQKTVGAISRFLMAIDDDPATQPGLRVRFGLKSGGTSGRIAHVYHVGLDKAAFPCWSAVVADAADNAGYPSYIESGTDEMRYVCDNGEPFTTARGTILMRAVLPFGIEALVYGGNEPAFFRLLGASGAFAGIIGLTPDLSIQFLYGSDVASIPITGTPDPADIGAMQELRLGFRWTSSLGELGYDQRADVFLSLDGITWYQGSVEITTLIDGAQQNWYTCGQREDRSSMWTRYEVVPICLPDAELKARLA